MKKKKVSIIIPIYNRSEDLKRLLASIHKSSFRDYEIIIVDNCSIENIEEIALSWSDKEDVRYMRLQKNMMAAGGRNAGMKEACGEYFLFVDSDNIVEPKMIEKLVNELDRQQNVGLIGPLMLYYKRPEIIWFAGNDISLFTSKTTYFNHNLPLGDVELPEVIKTHHIPNLMMTRRTIIEEVGEFDTEYYIMYEEADFATRVRKAGYEIEVLTDAITYHNCPTPDEMAESNKMRKLGCDNCERTYHFSKNRNIYMSKYASWFGKILYFSIFRFIFAAYYEFIAIKNNRYDIAKAWHKGMKYRYKANKND